MFAFDDVLDWRWRSAESLKPECKVIFSYNITVHSTVHNTVQYSTWCGELSSLESVCGMVAPGREMETAKMNYCLKIF